jgi:hypothetical protein
LKAEYLSNFETIFRKAVTQLREEGGASSFDEKTRNENSCATVLLTSAMSHNYSGKKKLKESNT